MQTKQRTQMELGFEARRAATPSAARPRSRYTRAAWWFEQMRLTVDRALEWRPAPPPPPRQVWLELAPEAPRL